MQKLFLTLFLVGSVFSCFAHVHGEGQLLIVQEDKQVQIQFIIPSSDILGFESTATTDTQKRLVQQLSKSLEDTENIVLLPPFCQNKEVQHSLKDFLNANESHKPTSSHSHSDITITVNAQCQKSLAKLNISIFSIAQGLQSLNAQWINANAQGAGSVSKSTPALSLR